MKRKNTWCVTLIALTLAPCAMAQNRSDVFLKNWDAEGAAKFRANGVTSLVPPSLVDATAIAAFKETVAVANENGRIAVGRIPLDYRINIYEEYAKQEGENLEDHICRSIEGDLMQHGWNGNVFLCSNSPFIREAMKQMVEICSGAGCDWISADLQTATHDSLQIGGCFCRHCLAGFAAFLKRPSTWSYREFLLERGYDTTDKVKREAWKKDASAMPLFREYRTFQHFALRECYDVIRDPQKKFLTSHDFHGHSAPLGTHVDFDSVGEAIQRSDNAKIPLLYRLTDAAGRFNYITEGPEGEWENTALGRLRLCQAYAYGAVWVVPHKQGIRRDGKWLRINPEVRDLYDFIHEHRHLFDGYDAWTSVGLIYSHLGHRRWTRPSEEATATLVRSNVPFKICVAGSDWWDPGLDLSGLNALVTTSDYRYLTTSQKATVEASPQPVVDVASLDRLWNHIPRPIQVSVGNAQINVVPRRKADWKLLHLVNMAPGTTHENFTITVSKQFAGVVDTATLYAPGRRMLTLRCRDKDAFTEFSIPKLKEWGIVTLFSDPAEENTAPAAGPSPR